MGTHPTHGILPGSATGRLTRPPARRKALEPTFSPEPQPPAALTLEQIALTHDEITRRAYEIYQARDAEGGDALSDWLTAERELRERAEASTCSPAGADREPYH